MNRKAFNLMTETTIGVIIAIAVIIFSYFYILQPMLGSLLGNQDCQDKVTLNSFNNLATEIDSFKTNSFLIQIAKKGCTLAFFNKIKISNKINSPDECAIDSCICLCQGAEEESCQQKGICKKVKPEKLTLIDFEGQYISADKNGFIEDIYLKKDDNSMIISKNIIEPEISQELESYKPETNLNFNYALSNEDKLKCENEAKLKNLVFDCSYFNFLKSGVRKEKIDTIILHHTGGSTVSSALYTLNAEGFSAHYIIDKEGKIYYLIDENLRALHAGDYNSRSIGIEIVNTAKSDDPYTDAQYYSLKALLTTITSERKLSYSNDVIKAHYEVSKIGKWDPSPTFKWDQIGLKDHKILTFAQLCKPNSDLRNLGYCNDITKDVIPA